MKCEKYLLSFGEQPVVTEVVVFSCSLENILNLSHLLRLSYREKNKLKNVITVLSYL